MAVFDKQWFERHQAKLLWLLNHWTTRRWFRGVLRIEERGPIIRILPNSYTIFLRELDNGMIEVKTDFRTHAKYAKRLYHAFFLAWLLLHVWDYLVADRFAPELSFGYDTLTAFPDAGSPGTTTVDGTVQYLFAATFAEAHDASAGTTNDPTSATASFTRATLTGGQFFIVRSFFLFDTSAIGAGAAISSAVLSLCGAGQATTNADTTSHDIVSAATAANTTLANGDYSTVGSTSFANQLLSAWVNTSGTYNDFTLNASGIANVSPTGISKFADRCNLDLSNTAPTGENLLSCRYADFAGTTQDPKLVVTYAITPKMAYLKPNKLRPRIFSPGLAR